MLMRPKWEGLETLEAFILENQNKFDAELLNGIVEVYHQLNDSEDVMEEVEGEILCEVDDYTNELQGRYDAIREKIENKLEKYDEDVADEIYGFVMDELDEFKIETFERPKREEESPKLVIQKMIQAGFVFNTGIGRELTIEYQEKERQEKEAKMIAEHIERNLNKWHSIRPYQIDVIRNDKDNFTFRSNLMNINAEYNIKTGKLKGKGVRKFREEIMSTFNVYMENMAI